MYILFEALHLIGAAFETANVVQTIIKFSLLRHLLPIKETHLI